MREVLRVTLINVLILVATGVVAGFGSGLLGVGGGFVMVPVMYWIVSNASVPQGTALLVAFGTSLLVILPTAMSGAYRHTRKGAVRWRAALVLGPCGLAGGFAGATLATYLPEWVLRTGFGLLVLAIAGWMMAGGTPRALGKLRREELEENRWVLAALGIPIGTVSGLTGLGGGALIVPALVLVLSFPIHVAVGTSVGSIIFTGIGGIIGYVVHGQGVEGLLPCSIGYVNLPMWLCLVSTSIPMAQVGARVAHALPANKLRYVFAGMQVYIGLRMVGVFDWFGLPL